MNPTGLSYKDTIEYLRNSQESNSEFAHLKDEVFLDHAANGIYTTSLIREYALKLAPSQIHSSHSLFSNPHSHSQSGLYTNMYVELTREKILNMFNTNQREYDLIFVHNVTDGLKLLAENFNFESQLDEEQGISHISQSNTNEETSCFVYLNDNHTSVLGMREIVSAKNIYCVFENESGEYLDVKLVKSTPISESSSRLKQRNLFVYPLQSNFNGRKYDFNLIEKVKRHPLMIKRSIFTFK